jgi:hypothetical protein
MFQSPQQRPVRAPWRDAPWLDPLEDLQVLTNAPEVGVAVSVAEPIDGHRRCRGRATIAFTDGTTDIEAVGEAPSENEARRHAAQNALIVLRFRAPELADSLVRRQAKNADKRRRRRRAAERRAARQDEVAA